MPSSHLSPICLPECRIPVLARPMLAVLLVLALSCIVWSDTGRLWQCILAGAALFEARRGLESIRDFKAFTLQRDATSIYRLDDGCGVSAISAVRWCDYRYLAIQHYVEDGRACSTVWWTALMPVPQRRQLRLWMNAPATQDAKELPSLLVNPVL